MDPTYQSSGAGYGSTALLHFTLVTMPVHTFDFIINTYREKHGIFRVKSYSEIQGKGQRDDSAVKSMNFSPRDLSSAPGNYTRQLTSLQQQLRGIQSF